MLKFNGIDPQWHEDNATVQDFHNILILEPCNYASNIAFCHAATEMCYSSANLSMSREYSVAITQVGISVRVKTLK